MASAKGRASYLSIGAKSMTRIPGLAVPGTRRPSSLSQVEAASAKGVAALGLRDVQFCEGRRLAEAQVGVRPLQVEGAEGPL